MVNFFHKFIPHFAERASPLNLLRKKDTPFVWGSEQQNAFQDLKLAIINPPVLRMAHLSRTIILQTDASSLAVAAVLLQEFEGERQPIAFASRTLSQQESKFSAYQLQCLAVLFGLEKFRLHLEHVEFDLETDNQALTWRLSSSPIGKDRSLVMRLSFKFQAHHIRGTQTVIADALSRKYDNEAEPVVAPILLEFPMLFQDIGTHHSSDPELNVIIQRLSSEEVPGYSLRKGVLHCRARHDRQPKIVVPQLLMPSLYRYFHESPLGAHLGVRKTTHRIRQSFIWKGMDSFMASRVRDCTLCGLSKPAQNTHYGKLSSDIVTRPMQKLFIDFVGKFPRSKSGNTYAFVCVDAFAKFV
jgi:hypothetical protein